MPCGVAMVTLVRFPPRGQIVEDKSVCKKGKPSGSNLSTPRIAHVTWNGTATETITPQHHARSETCKQINI